MRHNSSAPTSPGSVAPLGLRRETRVQSTSALIASAAPSPGHLPGVRGVEPTLRVGLPEPSERGARPALSLLAWCLLSLR